MEKSKEQPKYVEVKFTDAERYAFRMLHSMELHESVVLSIHCEYTTLFYVNHNTVRVVMHPDYLDEMSVDVLRARLLMVANTRVIEKTIGFCDSAVAIAASGKELVDELTRTMSKLTGMKVTSNYHEYRPVTITANNSGVGFSQGYRVDSAVLISDPLDAMATIVVKIKEDFNEYMRRTKE